MKYMVIRIMDQPGQDVEYHIIEGWLVDTCATRADAERVRDAALSRDKVLAMQEAIKERGYG